jgi:hypothetical protein
MNQLSIFPTIPRDFCPQGYRRIETPAARRSDPETSHEAAEHHTRSGARADQQAQTIAAIRAFPGRTMQELSELTGMDRYMLGRRVSECETAGAIRRMPKRKCRVTGRMAEPWEAV